MHCAACSFKRRSGEKSLSSFVSLAKPKRDRSEAHNEVRDVDVTLSTHAEWLVQHLRKATRSYPTTSGGNSSTANNRGVQDSPNFSPGSADNLVAGEENGDGERPAETEAVRGCLARTRRRGLWM